MRSWANEFLRFLRSRTRLSELDRNCRTDKDRKWKEEEEGNSRKIIREEYVRIYLFTFFALFFLEQLDVEQIRIEEEKENS